MKILKKQKLAEDIFLLTLQSPEISKKAKPGHFVLLQLEEKSPRIPFPIADAERNTISIIFEAKSKHTRALAAARKNQEIFYGLGPLGNNREVKEIGKIVLVGEGAGIGTLYFYAKTLKAANNRVISLLGGLSKKEMFWQDKIAKVSDKMFVIEPKSEFSCPLTHALEQILRKIRIDEVISFTSPQVMKSLAHATKLRTKNCAYLTATMMDGIGMCGSCRIHINGESKLCCVQGPEFDAHTVDWDNYLYRLEEFNRKK
ncbi:sulfide/dihydroorotate dehydrogenase-like FAD/NAD-binding protein [Candidatus Woesearchaeota archaeon]|nr:sulfide/dihydroorotate dehydrogenase-like FAD/NAD-binding protein [Candidatus Woesearchaeota archaeon]